MAAMSAESIEAQVIELVAQMADVKPERVTLTTRLLDDLGIDGDDAVEFFVAIHERFGTDLTHLDEEWDNHFGPEGLPLSAGLVIIPAAVGGVYILSLLRFAVGELVATIVGVATAAALIAVLILIGRKLGLIEDLAPITVGDVVRAVEIGAWP